MQKQSAVNENPIACKSLCAVHYNLRVSKAEMC